jgi:hypothetical protein
MTNEEQIAALDLKIAANYTEARKWLDKNKPLAKRRERLMDLIAKEAAEQPATRETLTRLMELGWSHGGGNMTASDAIEKIYGIYGVHRGGWARVGDTYIAQPQIWLTRGQPTDDLAIKVLELCRLISDEEVVVGVMERTLSEHGVYEIHVQTDAGTAELVFTQWHRPSTLLSGTLPEVLRKCAKDHWYREDE